MILNQAISSLAEDISDDMTNGEAGTNEALFLNTQTGVITAIASTDIALTDKVFSAGTINATYILTTALANGSDVAEYEVNNGTIAYNRVVKAAITKSSDDEISLLHTFELQIVI